MYLLKCSDAEDRPVILMRPGNEEHYGQHDRNINFLVRVPFGRRERWRGNENVAAPNMSGIATDIAVAMLRVATTCTLYSDLHVGERGEEHA